MSKQNLEDPIKFKLLNSIEPLSNKIKAFGHPIRLHILVFLLDKTESFNNIFDEIKKFHTIGTSALAHHLNSLENENLIEKVKRGEYKLTDYSKNMLLYFNATNETNITAKDHHMLPTEKTISSNPVYQPCWNSFVASLSGILNSLNVNFDYIDVGGRIGMSFPIIFETKSMEYKSIEAFNKQTFNSILKSIETYGFKVHVWEREKTFSNTWQLNDEDFEKVREMFEEIKHVLGILNTSVMLYGIRSYIYGIVKGYTNDSFEVSTFYRNEGRTDTPVRFDSIFVNDIFRFIYLTRDESIPFNKQPDYLKILQNILILLKGENIAKADAVAGPKAYDVWIDKLITDKSDKHSYFGRYFHDARLITTEYLERIARIMKGKKQAEFIMLASKEHRKVKNALEEFMMIFPYFESEKIVFTDETISNGKQLLNEAKKHEIQAIQYLEQAISKWE